MEKEKVMVVIVKANNKGGSSVEKLGDDLWKVLITYALEKAKAFFE